MSLKKPSLHKQDKEKMLEWTDDVRYAFGLQKPKLRNPQEYAKLLYPEVRRDERMSVVVYCRNTKGHQNRKKKPIETRLDPKTGMTETVECPECNQWVEPRGSPLKSKRLDSGIKWEIRRF